MAYKANKKINNRGKNNLGKNKDDDCFNKALQYSLLLLKYRARTKKEIFRRLKEKGWKNLLITKVVNYLNENKYLNDNEFVELFIESSLNKGWGQGRVCFHLRKAGVSFDFIENIKQQESAFLEVLKETIKNKISVYSVQDYEIGKNKILGRIARSMVAKGFNSEDVMRELNNLEEGCFENE